MEGILHIGELSREYWREGRRALVEHPDCLTAGDLCRFYPTWLATLYFDREALKDARPWITFAAARFLEGLLSRQSRVFEYGAGGSTRFFARQVGELVTVDHDPAWLERTAAYVLCEQHVRWRPHVAEPTPCAEHPELPASDPEAYASTDERYRDMSFRDYATTIEKYEDNYFDIVLIDGRARPSCFKHAVAKVKLGGHIVLDNADRKQYHMIEEMAEKLGFEKREFWGPGPYNRYYWRTLFLQKVRERFALNGLDSKLERYLDFDGGTFVEAGANDGVTQSNTLYFESRRGWRGLLVEPVPYLAEECRRYRPHARVEQAALVPQGCEAEPVVLRYANLMSTIRGGMRTAEEEDAHIAVGCEVQKIETYDLSVPCATLSSLLDRHGMHSVDLLSLDVEGYEVNVLKGLDFTRHRPRFILIEARYRDDVHAFLSKRYELVAELSGHDLLYRLRDDPGPMSQPTSA